MAREPVEIPNPKRGKFDWDAWQARQEQDFGGYNSGEASRSK